MLTHAGELEEAAATYQAVVAREPGNAPACWHLGLVLRNLNDTDGALINLYSKDLECRS